MEGCLFLECEVLAMWMSGTGCLQPTTWNSLDVWSPLPETRWMDAYYWVQGETPTESSLIPTDSLIVVFQNYFNWMPTSDINAWSVCTYPIFLLVPSFHREHLSTGPILPWIPSFHWSYPILPTWYTSYWKNGFSVWRMKLEIFSWPTHR